MGSEIDETLLHSDLSGLEKLSNFTFESKMLFSQKFSSKLMNGSEVDLQIAFNENIMPWEIEIFTAYSVIYNRDYVTMELDLVSFSEIITYIRNYWDKAWGDLERSGQYAEAFIMRNTIQQFPLQGVFLQKLFRYNYFFTFFNDKLDMNKLFINKFGAEYKEFDITAFIIFLVFSNETKMEADQKQILLTKAFQNKSVFSSLCIEKEEFTNEIKKLYKSDIIDLFYGLKAQYWWPFISGKDFTYIPSPYLIINAVTDSMLNRLTLNDQSLRNLIGKEILENYFYTIYKAVNSVTWISPEIEYYIGNQQYKTSDVLVVENEYCTFYDTKEMVPSLKIRKLDTEEIEKDIKIYAEAILQIYQQIKNYLSGHFELDKKYKKEKLFGVAVMLEGIALSHEKIYTKAFELYVAKNGKLDIEEQNFIHSHIKIVSLADIERLVLENNSFLPSLLNQEKNKMFWNDLCFANSYEQKGLIPIYEDYVSNLKGRYADVIKSSF
ncbi:MAG: hypothetical protein RR738_10560 [Anaerorhabdus sp.]|uniref:hypothetical protein n=1 Tax=Anaerorhabdus sp. TaxID=1872524 RepID=UPI002FC95064